MQKTIFKVPKMDCPSEEQMVRMAVDGKPGLRKIDFDLSKREVTLYHDVEVQEFSKLLESLNFGSQMISTEHLDGEELILVSDQKEAKALKLLLGINAAMFVIEIIIGWIAESTGLIADSLDMFADAAVYSLSLYAVARSVHLKKRAARLSGYFQMILALGVFFEVLRRFIFGSDPESSYMIGIASLALVANVSCLFLLFRHRKAGEHMRASWIFSTNDVIANVGVIVAGTLVSYFKSNIPDLAIGVIITVVVLRGAVSILRMARS